eukprot:14502137-Alexandrium_andersonii.AAC.1
MARPSVSRRPCHPRWPILRQEVAAAPGPLPLPLLGAPGDRVSRAATERLPLALQCSVLEEARRLRRRLPLLGPH